MDRGNVLSGAAFSAVLMSALVFLVVLITVGVVTHGYVERSMSEELRDDVRTRWDLFAADYGNKDIASVAELIANATLYTAQGRGVVGLFDSAGTPLAGNLLKRPDAPGWHEAALAVSGAATPTQTEERGVAYLYRSALLGEHTLVVGQRMDRLSLTKRAIFRTLAISGFVVVLAMLSAGYFLSRKSQYKLEILETTLARISDGDMSARMRLSSDNDQIDRIAERINTHLDTLSRLIVSTRVTAAAIAHDLKSPLARAYLGLGRALTQFEAGRDPRAEIEDTQAELERMNGIFDTFLRLARIEGGADGATFAELDLGALMDDLAETYQMVAEDKGQRFVYTRPDRESTMVMGDATMLQQLLVNLLENAVTHGGEDNRIGLCIDHAADHIHLIVSDSGPGIPKLARDAVFEPFYRLDPSRSKPGSGLGLALVRAIAERHGARVTLSDNAPGLRVVVSFPRTNTITGSPRRA